MFGNIGKEIQYLKKWVIILMFTKIRPEIQCREIIPVFKKNRAGIPMIKRIGPEFQ